MQPAVADVPSWMPGGTRSRPAKNDPRSSAVNRPGQTDSGSPPDSPARRGHDQVAARRERADAGRRRRPGPCPGRARGARASGPGRPGWEKSMNPARSPLARIASGSARSPCDVADARGDQGAPVLDDRGVAVHVGDARGRAGRPGRSHGWTAAVGRPEPRSRYWSHAGPGDAGDGVGRVRAGGEESFPDSRVERFQPQRQGPVGGEAGAAAEQVVPGAGEAGGAGIEHAGATVLVSADHADGRRRVVTATS